MVLSGLVASFQLEMFNINLVLLGFSVLATIVEMLRGTRGGDHRWVEAPLQAPGGGRGQHSSAIVDYK